MADEDFPGPSPCERLRSGRLRRRLLRQMLQSNRDIAEKTARIHPITQRVQAQLHSRPIWHPGKEVDSRRCHNLDRVPGPHPLLRRTVLLFRTGRCPQLGGQFLAEARDASFCVGSSHLLFGMYMQSRTTNPNRHVAGCTCGRRTIANGHAAK
jgi:hypothetical protein